MKDQKIIFMGTPEFSVPILEMLIENFNVILVVTKKDQEVGRKRVLKQSEIKECALKHGIKVIADHLKDHQEIIKELNPDIIITCAYGEKLPSSLINFTPLGCINVHASLLPKYRGGAPIHQAIIDGEETTGITIMYMDEGLDTGDIICQKQIPITKEDNVGTLHDKLSLLGRDTLKEILPSIYQKINPRKKQNEEESTFAKNIGREMEHIDFQKTGKEIYNQIRGLYPWPTANFYLNNVEYKALESYFVPSKIKEPGIIKEITKDAIGVTCQDGIIFITKIKPFGKKAMRTKDFLNGTDPQKLLNKKVNET